MKTLAITMNNYICEFCNKECKSKTSLIAHKVRCKLNPNRKFWKSSNGKGTGHPAWNKGLTKETDDRLKKRSETFLKRYNNGQYTHFSHPHTKETKERLSKKRSDYLSTAKNAGGFKDVGWYYLENNKQEQFVVRGTWEYNVAKKLNELNIYWIRNKYVNYFIDNIKHIYNPDFYLPEFNIYIEVKGYFSEKDKIKMDAVLDQNPDIKIYFMQYKVYKDFIDEKIDINKIPIYKISI